MFYFDLVHVELSGNLREHIFSIEHSINITYTSPLKNVPDVNGKNACPWRVIPTKHRCRSQTHEILCLYHKAKL